MWNKQQNNGILISFSMYQATITPNVFLHYFITRPNFFERSFHCFFSELLVFAFRFMDSIGPMVGIISQEIETKTSIIRKLAQKEEEKRNQQVQDSASHGAYVSVYSMIVSELERGLVNFDRLTESGCRTLLRLHRALLWLQLFLQSLAEEKREMMVRSPSELCREAYQLTLAQHHSWWVKKAAELAFMAMPDRQFFYKMLCVRTQAEAAALLNRVVKSIQKVYDRTQVALEEHDMLALP